MKNFKSSKYLILFISGILLIAGISILGRYFYISDTVLGLTSGLGIGLLLMAVILKKKSQSKA